MSVDSNKIYEAGEYWRKNMAFHEHDAEFKVANALKLIRKHGLVPSSVLDCGCGSGKDTYLLAKEFGVPTLGIDISGDAISHAQLSYSLSNLRFLKLEISAVEERVSLGVMFDVFEHVEDYFGFLRTARGKADYWVFNIPLDMNVLTVARAAHMNARAQVGHLHYYSEETACATLEDCGYSIVDRSLESAVLQDLRKKTTVKGVIAAIPRLALFKFSPSLSVRLLGGACLTVLCKAHPS